jgi:D-serine deaminase-like pyridoxal phosphate-dependent protein|tara:strand:- start:1018 stop:2154 length:1137 start_codon:yes stop_codon:yes gene_type:complete
MKKGIYQKDWFNVIDSEKLISPGLIIFPEIINRNIKNMVSIAGSESRLWPHVKTHKLEEVVNLQKQFGIKKFKCATICEANMLASCEVENILLAIQPSIQNLKLLIELQSSFPKIEFSTIVDNQNTLKLMTQIAQETNIKLALWLDINNGMNRTGVFSKDSGTELIKTIFKNKNLIFKGLHVYDGHIRHNNYKKRKEECDKAYSFVDDIKNEIEKEGVQVPNIITGGSPTFNIHSKRKGNFLSPGTTLLWDAGYESLFPEMNFEIGALVVSRVISKPQENLLCFDLGHKSVASEMPLPRVIIHGLEKAKHISQSEEHLIVETSAANEYEVGDIVYATPYHICPTVAKYEYVQTIEKERVSSIWQVKSRTYNLNNVFNF